MPSEEEPMREGQVMRIKRVEVFPLVSERPKFNRRQFPIPATQER